MDILHEAKMRFWGPSREQLASWERAKRAGERNGNLSQMVRLVYKLGTEGDNTAEVWENSPKTSDKYALTLYFSNNNNRELDAIYGAVPTAKAIRLTSGPLGELKIEYTKSNRWKEIEDFPRNKEDIAFCLDAALASADSVPHLQSRIEMAKGKRVLPRFP